MQDSQTPSRTGYHENLLNMVKLFPEFAQTKTTTGTRKYQILKGIKCISLQRTQGDFDLWFKSSIPILTLKTSLYAVMAGRSMPICWYNLPRVIITLDVRCLWGMDSNTLITYFRSHKTRHWTFPDCTQTTPIDYLSAETMILYLH